MKRYLLTAVVLLLLFHADAQPSSRVLFTHDWLFKLDSMRSFSEPDADDKNWRRLDLPHDWSIEGEFNKNAPAGTGGGALPGGIGWYRKKFSMPTQAKNKTTLVSFDGVYRNSEVFINGHLLGKRPNGYISFSYDLSPYLFYDGRENVLAVKADNSKQPNSRWYSGSGIYRNVWLSTVDKSHIDLDGTFITSAITGTATATVKIRTNVVNGNGLSLITEIVDQSGVSIASVKSPIGAGSSDLQQSVVLRKPMLWSVDRPYLYTAVTKLVRAGYTIDTYRTRLGIRSFEFDREKGFFLNGKEMKILGVCLHHDLGALGAAINKSAIRRQLKILKEMGCNGIRTSHNPPAPELLDLADEMGFIVMDEAFDMWVKEKSVFDYHLDWADWHKRDLEDFVRRDRNHPSVFIWSVGNEIYEQWTPDSSGRTISRELAGIVRSLDSTRPITTANNEIKSNHLIQSNAFELVGYNYHHQNWGSFLNDWPGKKLIITESTSALETRGYYDKVPADTLRRWPVKWDIPFNEGNKDLTVSAYDHVSTPWGSTHEESIRELKKYDHVSGMYIWTGFDYLGEPTPYPWPARSSYFGIVDLAGFPKDVYYLYQAEFTSKNILHLLPHWNWIVNDTVDVVAYYNNADEVELYLNGRSLGKRSKGNEEYHVTWTVPFSPGTLKAISRKNGRLVKEVVVSTAGEPHQLRMTADRNLLAKGITDMAFVQVDILDEEGRIVPDASNHIRFSLTGAATIAGVDNGDPVSLEPFKSNQHTAMNGKALCIVSSDGKAGEITLTAKADGLKTSTIRIMVK